MDVCLFVCLTPMISATANPIAIKLSKKCRGHAPGGLCGICKKIARKLGRLWPINVCISIHLTSIIVITYQKYMYLFIKMCFT